MRPVNSIDELLEHMVARDASDLHVTVGTPPVIRVRGEIERVADYSPLTPDETQELLYRILSSEQQKNLEIKRQLDFSHSIPGLARFRVNVYFQRESIGAAFRRPCTSWPRSRAASSSSPARPVPVSRRRSPRSSTRSTENARSTSSRSRTRSSFCTATNAASSISARSAPTQRALPRPCAQHSARTPT